MDFNMENKQMDEEKLKNEYFNPLRQIIQRAVNQLVLIRGEVKGQVGQGEGYRGHYNIREVLRRQRRKRTPLSVHMMKYRNVGGGATSPVKQILQTSLDWSEGRKLFPWNSTSGESDPTFLMERMKNKILTPNSTNSMFSREEFKTIWDRILSDMTRQPSINENIKMMKLNGRITDKEIEKIEISLEQIVSNMKGQSSSSDNLDLELLGSNEKKSPQKMDNYQDQEGPKCLDKDKDQDQEGPKCLDKIRNTYQGHHVQGESLEEDEKKQVNMEYVSMEAIKYENEDNKSNNRVRETTGNDVHVEIDVMDDGEMMKKLDRQVANTSAPNILCHVTPQQYGRSPLQVSVRDEDGELYCTPRAELRSETSPIFYTAPNRVTPILRTETTSTSGESIVPGFVFGQESLVPVLCRDSVEFLSSKRDDFILVGRGTYGCVYLANVSGYDRVACVKEFFPEMTSPEDVAREAMILNYLQDTGVVPKFYGILMNENNPEEVSIVQDFYGNGITLKDLLFRKTLKFNPAEIVQLFSDLASGLHRIHRKEILCNDVKADNILVDCSNGNQVAFIDFGVATYKGGRCFHVPDNSKLYSHLAPEVRRRRPTSAASDVYSLGHLMSSILELYPAVVNRVTSLAEVVRSCLDACPALRPNPEEIIAVSQDAMKLFKDVDVICKNENGVPIKS